MTGDLALVVVVAVCALEKPSSPSTQVMDVPTRSQGRLHCHTGPTFDGGESNCRCSKTSKCVAHVGRLGTILCPCRTGSLCAFSSSSLPLLFLFSSSSLPLLFLFYSSSPPSITCVDWGGVCCVWSPCSPPPSPSCRRMTPARCACWPGQEAALWASRGRGKLCPAKTAPSRL